MLNSVLSLGLICVSIVASQEWKIQHANAIWRHGDRAPQEILGKNAAVMARDWPNGLGQLSNLGVKEHFGFGQWMQRRYGKTLLPPPYVYRNSRIYVRSTDFDRTIMSAQSNMAGFFHDRSNNTEIHSDLDWHPVPVHNIPIGQDRLLLSVITCPFYKELSKDVYEQPHVVKELKPYMDTFDILKAQTGLTEMPIKDAQQIYDNYFCMREHDIPWPAWLTDEVWANMSSINDIYWKYMFAKPQLPRLFAGLIMNDFRNHMIAVSKGEPPMPGKGAGSKIIFYSSHDIDVAGVLAAFGYELQTQPPYTASVHVELWNKGDQWNVRTLYRNWTGDSHTKKPINVIPPGCPTDNAEEGCPLAKWLEVTKANTIVPSEYNTVCHISNEAKGKVSNII